MDDATTYYDSPWEITLGNVTLVRRGDAIAQLPTIGGGWITEAIQPIRATSQHHTHRGNASNRFSITKILDAAAEPLSPANASTQALALIASLPKIAANLTITTLTGQRFQIASTVLTDYESSIAEQQLHLTLNLEGGELSAL